MREAALSCRTTRARRQPREPSVLSSTASFNRFTDTPVVHTEFEFPEQLRVGWDEEASRRVCAARRIHLRKQQMAGWLACMLGYWVLLGIGFQLLARLLSSF